MLTRRRSIGLDGAESEFCDLSGRGLATAQVERTLRVFETAVAIDMSNNELELIPTTIPIDLVALDVSFNLLPHAHGLERLKNLRELHLGFNRLTDVSILEFCPLLQRVNLSGNRLMNTRGLETLVHLENLDLSDNLIEFPDALRALSLNHNLTHLTLRGNPITSKTDTRVLVLDMMPSVLILDEKKIRASTKAKTVEASATKSLSYARIYDDKKQFMIQNKNRRTPGTTRPPPILVGCDPGHTVQYGGNTVFLQSPTAVAMPHDLPYERVQSPHAGDPSASAHIQSVRLTSPTGGGQPYMSLYDRLAQANGITVNKLPEPVPVPVPVAKTAKDRPPSSSRSSHPPRESVSKTAPPPAPSLQPRRSIDSTPKTIQGNSQSRPATPAQPITTAQSRPPTPAYQTSTQQQYPSRPPTASPPSPLPQASPYQRHHAPHHPTVAINQSPSPLQASTPVVSVANQLDSKQQNVLSVIQNLIQHKKQTLATLARESSSTTTAAVMFS